MYLNSIPRVVAALQPLGWN